MRIKVNFQVCCVCYLMMIVPVLLHILQTSILLQASTDTIPSRAALGDIDQTWNRSLVEDSVRSDNLDKEHPTGWSDLRNCTRLGQADSKEQTARTDRCPPSVQSSHGRDTLPYAFNCSNIPSITVKRKLGHGVSKQVMLGLYNTKKVAVKMVTRNVIDVTTCLKHLDAQVDGVREQKQKCYVFPNMKLMKEILLLQQLNHNNLVQLLGYCVRSEETESTSLHEHGVVAVYEYALRFYTLTLRSWPLHARLKTAYELADLLDYFEHSPLGSLCIADFKDAHFLLKDGHIKLTDMDDVSNIEASCVPASKATAAGTRGRRSGCDYGLQCVGGICPGHNAKRNLDNMGRLFFSDLLVTDNAGSVADNLLELSHSISTLSIDASELKIRLSSLMLASEAQNGR